MSNYVKATNFATKDALLSGNPAKIIKGTEIDDEFNAISTAIGTKADLASPTFTGTPAAPTAVAGTNTTQLATTAFVASAITTATGSLGTISTQNANNVSITGGSITGITDLAVADGGTGASSITANSVILGNGTSALNGNLVAPGSSGNILTSNGTTWTSAAPAAPTALSTASGSAPSYSARAWVNFNGTGANSTNQTINASGNVSSVFRNSAGDYTITFTTALPNANYATIVTATSSDGRIGMVKSGSSNGAASTKSTTQVQILIKSDNNVASESADISVIVMC